MRVFKHGDALAIVLPPAIKASSQVSENDEFEFFELEQGILVMVSKAKLSSAVKEKAVALLLRRAMDAPSAPAASASPADSAFVPASSLSASASSTQPFARRQNSYPDSEPQFVSAAELAKRTPVANKSIDAILGGNGYAILDEAAAKVASKELESFLSHGDVYGAKGFDNKFYVISREQFEPLAEKIISRITRGTEIVPEKAAEALKDDSVKVACALHVLKERGDALEKKRGVFMLLD
jgi:hypothetical protein